MLALLNTLSVCELAFRALERQIPCPVRVQKGDDFELRYAEQTPQIVVVQKLSRKCTGLRAVLALLEKGLYQEVGVMFRLLDEFHEDVSFMCEAIRTRNINAIQRRFINDFFQEEFGDETPLRAPQRRNRVPRGRIHAALARLPHGELNPSDAQEVARTITKTNSGYVHGTSECILEMYGGDPPRYHLDGMLGTRRQETFEELTWNYFYRSLLAFMEAVGAFGLNDLLTSLFQFRDYFEQQWGRADWPSPEELIREMRRKARR